MNCITNAEAVSPDQVREEEEMARVLLQILEKAGSYGIGVFNIRDDIFSVGGSPEERTSHLRAEISRLVKDPAFRLRFQRIVDIAKIIVEATTK